MGRDLSISRHRYAGRRAYKLIVYNQEGIVVKEKQGTREKQGVVETAVPGLRILAPTPGLLPLTGC